MKKIALQLVIIVSILSCSRNNSVRLVDTNFNDEISVNQVLSFTFSKDMVPDSLVGTWSDVEYIRFSPKAEGKFHWQNRTTLSFASRNGFSPVTQYSAKFTDRVFEHLNNAKYTDDREFTFHTPMLEVSHTRAHWKLNERTQEQGIGIDLTFNYPVEPQQVAKLLRVAVNGHAKEFEVQSTSTSRQISAWLGNIEREDKAYEISIDLDKELKVADDSDPMDEAYREEFELPSPFKLEISNIEVNHQGDRGVITLFTTQEVVEKNIKSFISIQPSVKYAVTIESGSVLIESESFSMNQHYDITIKKGLEGILGGLLKYDYSQPISFGKVEPTIKFAQGKEFYLSGQGARNIQLNILNVPKVKVRLVKLYENNLLAYMKGSGYSDYYYDYEYDEYYYSSSANVGDLGDEIYSKELETSTLPRKGGGRLLTLDMEDRLAEYPGMYVLEVRSTEKYWLNASRLIAISDIGLIVKEGKNRITVFANSIAQATPLADVRLRFIGKNNQTVHEATTNGDGVAVYRLDELQSKGFKISLITARHGADYNVIPLNKTRINTSRFDVGGKYSNPSDLEAFIYGDRNLYRPGETVNISAIIRDKHWQLPGEIPVLLKFIAPNGKTFKTSRHLLSNQGAFEAQIPVPTTAQTGSYVANLYTGSDVFIGSKVIKVEEFMPDRIQVDLKLDKQEYRVGESMEVALEAINFFGPPAADRNYEVEVTTQRTGFYPKQNREYNYSISGTHASFNRQFRQGETDAEGKVSESFAIPKEYQNIGVLQSDVFTTVFDETGRPVNRLQRSKIYTQEVFYGMRNPDSYVRTNQPIQVDLVAVDKEGSALSDVEAEVKLIRWDYKTILSKSGSYFKYRSEKVKKVLQQKTIKINELGTHFSFIPELSGEYELRISKPGTGTYVRSTFYAYGWGSTSYGSFKVNNEGQIDIKLDKKAYQVGDKAHILFKTPFSGRLLVTVETDEVLDYYYLDTDKRAVSLTLDIADKHIPNIYVSATLFRPHQESDLPLTVAHGYAALKVDNPDFKMPVSIACEEKSRANTTQTIKVKAQPNSPLTIAVVDEGILQVDGTSTPDAYKFFYQKRALEVLSSTMYPYLFPELGMVRSQTGGGGSMMEKRLNPMQSNRVKLVTFWSGILTTNSRGEAEFDIDIPQFSGDLRIMALGYNGQVFGSASANMKVADPVVLSVALPRFLSPGDKVAMPVVLTNTTEKSVNCKARLELQGPVKLLSETPRNMNLEPGTEQVVNYQLEANQELGQAKVSFGINVQGEEFVNTTDITVRPASPLQKRSGSGQVDAGKSMALELETANMMEASVAGRLIISKNPLVQFTKSLDYLVRYPYGCVEQTVSAAFPQLYYSDLLGVVFESDKAGSDALRNVQQALDRIKLMQLYNGGLTYWPGNGRESWWGSVYAAHFTVEAKKAGYEVDEDFLKDLLKYLKKQLQGKNLITYYYNRTMKKDIAPREAIYSLYVLSLAGENPASLLNYYANRSYILSLDSKYLLAASYALCGNTKKAMELVPMAFEGEESVSRFGGSFSSPIRDEALALNALLEIDPDNQQIGLMARHISDAMKNKRYLNTQERSFSLLAMGKIARTAAGSNIQATVHAGNKEVANFNNSDLSLSLDELGNNRLQIEAEGSGNLYYFCEVEGITADGSYQEEDSYLKVRRQFYDRYGRLVSNNTFAQNDLVLVQIALTGLTDTYVENIAISDLLPACFEIENPRLTTLPPGMRFPHTRHTPEYVDIRDDRINMFTSISNSTRYYYYLVRVVSKGEYQMGPIGADAMYKGEYHSCHGAGTVVVN